MHRGHCHAHRQIKHRPDLFDTRDSYGQYACDLSVTVKPRTAMSGYCVPNPAVVFHDAQDEGGGHHVDSNHRGCCSTAIFGNFDDLNRLN